MPLPVDPDGAASSSVRAASATNASPSSIVASATTLTPTWTPSESSGVTGTPVSTLLATSATPDSLTASTSRPMVVVPKPLSTTILTSGSLTSFTFSVPPTTSTPPAISPTRSRTASLTTVTTDITMDGTPLPSVPPPQDIPSGIISSLPKESSGADGVGVKKSRGSPVAAIAGVIVALVLCGFLGMFLWRWRKRRQYRGRHLSFGPHGNGIDASRGNVLVSSVACMPADAISIGDSAYENTDYIPPPRSRYFQPTVDTGRMFLRPIPSIAEVSERDSGDFEKHLPKPTFGFEPLTNPFDDINNVEKAPTLPNMGSLRRKPPPPPISDRSRQHIRSRSSDSIGEQRHPMSWENGGYGGPSPADSGMRMGRMNSNRQMGPRQDYYGYPHNHPYARAPPANLMRMHSGQRRQRSSSLNGEERRQARNPVVDGPAWRAGPPPMRRPSVGYGNNPIPTHPPNTDSPLARTLSLRERPSPELWNGPNISQPLHLSRSNTRTGRLGSDHSPDNAMAKSWGSVSNFVQGEHQGSKPGDAARNF